MEIPITWILSAFVTLTGTISGMALTIWLFMKERLSKQDVLIEKQNITIHALQKDVDRLSDGCGVEVCVWKKRH